MNLKDLTCKLSTGASQAPKWYARKVFFIYNWYSYKNAFTAQFPVCLNRAF